jgi:hypothetical protein
MVGLVVLGDRMEGLVCGELYKDLSMGSRRLAIWDWGLMGLGSGKSWGQNYYFYV